MAIDLHARLHQAHITRVSVGEGLLKALKYELVGQRVEVTVPRWDVTEEEYVNMEMEATIADVRFDVDGSYDVRWEVRDDDGAVLYVGSF